MHKIIITTIPKTIITEMLKITTIEMLTFIAVVAIIASIAIS
jgi:hypothetical protein